MKKYLTLIIFVILSIQTYAFFSDFDAPSLEFSESGFNPNKDKILMTVDEFGQLVYMDFIVNSDNIGAFFNLEDNEIYVNNIYLYFYDSEAYLISIDDKSEIIYKGTKLPKMDPGSLVRLDKSGNLLEMRYTTSEKNSFINPLGNAIVIYKKNKDKETYILRNGEMKISGLVNLNQFNGKALINNSILSLGEKGFNIFNKEFIDIGGKFSAIVPTNLKLENSKINLFKDDYIGEVVNKQNFNILTGKLKENTNLVINGLTELNINSLYANIKPHQATFINSLTDSAVRINQLNIDEFLLNNKILRTALE